MQHDGGLGHRVGVMGTLSARPRAWPDDLVALYRNGYSDYVRLGYLLLGSRQLAEEAVQDAFIACAPRWESVTTSPGGYVRTAVVNACRARMRRGRVESLHQPDPPPADAPADLVDLRDSLARLPWAQQVAIVLRYWGGHSDAEIASTLDCRPATVRSHLARGLARLRKDLDR